MVFLSYFDDNINTVALYKNGDEWIELGHSDWNYGTGLQQLHEWPAAENYKVCLCCSNTLIFERQ